MQHLAIRVLVDGRAVAERGVDVAGGGRAARAARAGPRGAVRLHAREDPAQSVCMAAAERVAVGVVRSLRATRAQCAQRGSVQGRIL
eukprot:COSAG02_NODE_925_length_15858_cov_4.267276_5_plen_87_part_00